MWTWSNLNARLLNTLPAVAMPPDRGMIHHGAGRTPVLCRRPHRSRGKMPFPGSLPSRSLNSNYLGDIEGVTTRAGFGPSSKAPVARRGTVMTRTHFAEGQILFREGDSADCVFRLLSGAVEIVRELNGDLILLGTVSAGQFIGEMGVVESRPRNATARAANEVE